jgi:hypothetical protein
VTSIKSAYSDPAAPAEFCTYQQAVEAMSSVIGMYRPPKRHTAVEPTEASMLGETLQPGPSSLAADAPVPPVAAPP